MEYLEKMLGVSVKFIVGKVNWNYHITLPNDMKCGLWSLMR